MKLRIATNQQCIKCAWESFYGPNLAIFEPKILIFTGVSKKFDTHSRIEPPTHLVRIVFWLGIGSNGPKMPVLGQIFLGGWSKILVPSYQGTNHTSFVLKTLTGTDSIGRQGRKCAILTRKIGYLGPKVIFCFGIAIFVNSAYYQYTQGFNSPILTIPEKISVSELWFIFWGSPRFWAIPTSLI